MPMIATEAFANELIYSGPKKKRIRVLHVDDDEVYLIISKQILALQTDFEIDYALSVCEAFEKLSDKDYDVIVSDYDMPVRNGLDFLKMLKAQKKNIPFVFFTGKGREDVAVKALNLGAEGYYNKQGDPETVYAELTHGIKLVYEKNMAKKAFEESEKRYHSVMENVTVAIYIHDASGQILDVNPQACVNVGYSREELLQMNLSQIIDVASDSITLDMRKEYWVRALAGETITFEGLNKRKDQSIFPVEVSVRKVVVAQKDYVMSSVIDVSQRVKSYEEMTMFYDILELATDAIVIYDLDGKFLYFNEETCKQRGYSREEFLKLTVPQITAPKYVNALSEFLPTILSCGEGTLKSVHMRKDGSEMPVEIRARTISFNDQKLILSVIRDVTEQEQREIALKESKENLRHVVFRFPEAVFLLDKDTFKTSFANFEDFCGYTVAEMEKPFTVLRTIHPNERALVESYWQQAIKYDCEPTESIEYRMQAKDGSWQWVETRLVFLSDRQGKPRQILGTMKNVTERKKAEEALKESHKQLERLTETLRVTGSLTRHDVRNKLMVASSNLYLLKKKVSATPEMLKYIEGIEIAIKQTDKLFEFSRLYEKIGGEKQVEVNVGSCFDQATRLLLSQDNIKVTNQCQDLTLTADSLLSQLFYNLIDNSIRHGERVTDIKLSYTQDGKETNLIYEDNGKGIPVEAKEKIFSEGYTTGGSGLGLKLVKRLLEAYGWTIEEVGVPEQGAKFCITVKPFKN